jgi:hypothetical protein
LVFCTPKSFFELIEHAVEALFEHAAPADASVLFALHPDERHGADRLPWDRVLD